MKKFLNRHSTRWTPTPDDVTSTNSVEEFSYRPLEPSLDSMRILELNPPKKNKRAISCELIHVTFKERPKYEALSYTWGDDMPKENIFVCGRVFRVGRNLYNALQYLQQRPADLRFPIWVDAICINQKDTLERNQQVQIMPHIYTRAMSVLVWLGSPAGAFKVDTSSWAHTTAPSALVLSSYWKRVWIIQEIGKARQIQVIFHGIGIPWGEFINKLRQLGQPYRNSAPMLLDQQLRAKYERGHTLQHLLELHQESVCKVPHDKIYGFVGLATDCYKFPIDYKRSLLEVWKDTMSFVSARNMVSNIALFGRLVRRQLGGDNVAKIDNVRRVRRANSGPRSVGFMQAQNSETIRVPVHRVGQIIHIGPSIERVIGILNASDEWTHTVRKNFKSDAPFAELENDLFLQALEENDKGKLQKLAFPYSNVRWKVHGRWKNYPRFGVEPQEMSTAMPDDHQHLLFQSTPIETCKPNAPLKSSRLGIAPQGIEMGDLICTVYGIEKAVIVRKKESFIRESEDQDDNHPTHFEIVGTAVLSIDLVTQEVKENLSCTRNDNDTIGVGIDLLMDGDSAYVLLC
jgi:Heterokaryon incompatibility protein (HET)